LKTLVKSIVFLVVISLLAMPTIAQNDNEQELTYRMIRITGDDSALNAEWYEIWEGYDPATRTRFATMIEAESDVSGNLDYTCYYAYGQGNRIIYMVDGVVTPVGDVSADEFWQELENRNLFNNSAQFATSVNDCDATGSDTVNSIASDYCRFSDVDASTIIKVRTPATAMGELWTSQADNLPVRYQFAADGSTEDAFHDLDRLLTSNSNVFAPPSVIQLQCIDGEFPTPDGSTIITPPNLSAMSFDTPLSPSELRLFYDDALLDTWISSVATGSDVAAYFRETETGAICNLRMTFTEQNPGTTTVSVRVTTDVELNEVPLPEGFPSPVVIQSAQSGTRLTQSVGDTVTTYRTTFDEQGWMVREDLTDVRENSAFVAFERDTNVMFMTVRGGEQSASMRLRTFDRVCGPTFAVNQ
jgi:hypothetical protein